MLEIFERHPYLAAAVVVTVLFGIILQIIIGNVLGHMINEAENIASTENKQLKQFKLKFVNCYKLNEGMGNVTVFVERFLEKLEVGKIKLTTMHRISGQLVLFSVFLSGIGAARSIVLGETIGQILPFYVLAFLGLYLYFVSSSFAGIEEKKLSLKFSLVDYLDNHMVGRLKQTEEVLNQKLVEKQEEPLEKEHEYIFSEKDKQELEVLLREFLT
ncbi:MAG: hypothetical protein IKJ15_04535 [Lachnospiraceae bacterium]|nr:hypothetical protein [Lachnospiraceae bacterium]